MHACAHGRKIEQHAVCACVELKSSTARTFLAGAALDLFLNRARVFTETDLECLFTDDGSANRGYAAAGRAACSDGSARPPLTLVDTSMDCAIILYICAAPRAPSFLHRQHKRHAQASAEGRKGAVRSQDAEVMMRARLLRVRGGCLAPRLLRGQFFMNEITRAEGREAGVARTGGGDWRAAGAEDRVRGGLPGRHVSANTIYGCGAARGQGQAAGLLVAAPAVVQPHVRWEWGGRGMGRVERTDGARWHDTRVTEEKGKVLSAADLCEEYTVLRATVCALVYGSMEQLASYHLSLSFVMSRKIENLISLLYFQLQLQKAPFLLCGVELWSRR